MTERQYQIVTEAIKKKSYGPTAVRLFDKLISVVIFILYPVFLGELYLLGDMNILIRSVAIPAAGFLLVSLVRSSLHVKRPYEVYDFEPIIRKETIEHSFPSRHVFSATIIAVTFMQLSVENGLEILLLTCILAFLRVVGGVHFPKDVIAGIVIGLLWGLLYLGF